MRPTGAINDLQINKKERKDLQVLALFTSIWCKTHHNVTTIDEKENADLLSQLEVDHYLLCPDCREFLSYACMRRIKCPLDPKPTCKHCHLHCYRPGHREKVREIMRFSGRYLILRGRLDLLWHYFF